MRRVRHKFNAQPVEFDGIKFPSKREGKRYNALKMLQLCGEVVFFLRQVPFHLPGNVVYRCDFQVFWADGHVGFEDTKGFLTAAFKRNMKQVQAMYPIKIELL